MVDISNIGHFDISIPIWIGWLYKYDPGCRLIIEDGYKGGFSLVLVGNNYNIQLVKYDVITKLNTKHTNIETCTCCTGNII